MSSQTPNLSPPRDHTQYVTSSPDGFLSFGRCGWEGGGGGGGAAVEDGGVRREEGGGGSVGGVRVNASGSFCG